MVLTLYCLFALQGTGKHVCKKPGGLHGSPLEQLKKAETRREGRQGIEKNKGKKNCCKYKLGKSVQFDWLLFF